jgi:hypothetical protein
MARLKPTRWPSLIFMVLRKRIISSGLSGIDRNPFAHGSRVPGSVENAGATGKVAARSRTRPQLAWKLVTEEIVDLDRP